MNITWALRNRNIMSSLEAIHSQLLTYPPPLLPPGKALVPELTAKIAALSLHPTLEVGLHILNQDLPSAHFLVRHMQSAPAFAGMYLHGILHRIEGDFDNARAWYSDVRETDVYKEVWGSRGIGWKELEEGGKKEDLDDGQKFLDAVQQCKESAGQDEREELEAESKREIDTVFKWCSEKFGTDKMVDASEAWVKPSDDIKRMGEGQVSGSGGRRKF
jgi:hypothetical protein